MITPNRVRPSPPSVMIPATPPLMYASHYSTPPCSTSSSSSSSTSYFSPASPTIMTPRQEREIMMGGLVSRTPSPRDSGEYDEKLRQGSIEVPGIVLSECGLYGRPSPSIADAQPSPCPTPHRAAPPRRQSTSSFSRRRHCLYRPNRPCRPARYRLHS